FGSPAHAQASLRNSLPLINLAYDTTLFWDGRVNSLEALTHTAIMKYGILGGDTNTIVQRLAGDGTYKTLFAQAFPSSSVSYDGVVKAIATFMRCMISGNS